MSLTGSDFTGLGIEIYGGLKEGIFVKKVSSRGPASGIVNTGDRITGLTIDFRHIVLEDAISILSYASPYNVQLELIDGKGHLPAISNSPKDNQSSISHPLYRSSSQDNFDTIERNSRKKLFPNDESNYPTLKIESSTSPSPKLVLSKVHKENEKEKKNSFKQQIRHLVEEKLQNRSSSPEKSISPPMDEKSPTEKKKSGMQFGIRVLPPNVNEKIFGKSSPTKVDNENNQNLEKVINPPQAMKRNNKDKSPEAKIMTTSESSTPTTPVAAVSSIDFQRNNSINSSGIKRDPAGIPQEMPNHMMNAAMAAKENRKSSVNTLESKKSKGKAPKPPLVSDDDINISTTTMETNFDVSIDQPDAHEKSVVSDKMNFSDNFVDQIMEKNRGIFYSNSIESRDSSNNSTPKSDRRKNTSDTESQLALGVESDHDDDTANKNQISLDSNHITVHQASEGESGDEGRRAASLGDLSKFDTKNKTGKENRPNQGTLERAQSLEMSDQGGLQLHGNNNSNKRKATISDTDLVLDSKEPRLMDLVDGKMDTLQRTRLKSAYEFGTLQDAFNDERQSRQDDDDFVDNDRLKTDGGNLEKHTDIIHQVMAVADKFNKELQEEIVSTMENINPGESKNKENITTNVIIVDNSNQPKVKISNHAQINNDISYNQIDQVTVNRNDDVTAHRIRSNSDDDLSLENSELIELHREPLVLNNVFHDERITISPIIFPVPINQKIDIEPSSDNLNATDQVKFINYGTNIPDDIKVSRYPFGSLERPKSDVLKKLLELQNKDKSGTSNVTTIISATPSETTTTTKLEPETSLYLDTQLINSDFIQKSPIYSSDNHGINSISISSMEVNTQPEIRINEPKIVSGQLGLENVVTVLTQTSQPSSIIMIEDENLDFTLQTPNESNTKCIVTANNRNSIPSYSEDEVFEDTSLDLNNCNLKTFVTEINVKSSSNENLSSNNSNSQNSNAINIVSTSPQISSLEGKSQLTSSLTNFLAQEKQHLEDNFIPRNSEIRFTTSTYESPMNKTEQPKRLSHIDQIRSNFESKNTQHTTSSEIPIPVRKSSSNGNSVIPTTLKSPSKIPILHSNSFSSSKNSPPDEHHISTTTAQLVQPKTSPTGNNNRVSVTVTSIKNLSRHPSGKL